MMGGDLATEVLQLFGIGSCSVKIIGRRNPYSQVNFCDVIIINIILSLSSRIIIFCYYSIKGCIVYCNSCHALVMIEIIIGLIFKFRSWQYSMPLESTKI